VKECNFGVVLSKMEKNLETVLKLKKKAGKLTKKERENLKEVLRKVELRNEHEINNIINISHKIGGKIGRVGDELVRERIDLNKRYEEIKKELD
jgi:hypothetical protein